MILKPIRLIFLIFPLIFLTVAFSPPLSAQIGGSLGTNTRWGGQDYIVGTVYGPSGKRVDSRIQLRLISLTRSDILASTDDEGRFGFGHVPPGEYMVVIDGEKDFEPVSQRVVIEVAGYKQTYTVNIRLAYKTKAAPQPSVV